mmetsp:Transcript_2068/g.2982  ORF Transcript_2068/g.2982 Transcript_2068/m.2982 type:complete len:200 (+) Transcript_2068:274-873(+)
MVIPPLQLAPPSPSLPCPPSSQPHQWKWECSSGDRNVSHTATGACTDIASSHTAPSSLPRPSSSQCPHAAAHAAENDTSAATTTTTPSSRTSKPSSPNTTHHRSNTTKSKHAANNSRTAQTKRHPLPPLQRRPLRPRRIHKPPHRQRQLSPTHRLQQTHVRHPHQKAEDDGSALHCRHGALSRSSGTVSAEERRDGVMV